MRSEKDIMMVDGRPCCSPGEKHVASLLVGLVMVILCVGVTRAQTKWLHVVLSKDGVPISYEVFGSGEPTLVFVHGWSCDSRYWRCQVPYFGKNHRVVTIDFAGHGHSGTGRT